MSSAPMTLSLSSRLCLSLAMGAFCLAPDSRAQEGDRRERAAQTQDTQEQENDEIRTVRKRLKVMRLAVDAFLEAEKLDAADLVERAMHARELAIEGRRDEEANRIRESAPNRGQLAELLGAASNLYEKWGQAERSKALAELSKVYGQQWRRRQEAERKGRTSEGEQEREPRRAEGLDSLERRVRIIEVARQAYDKAGHERNEAALARAVRYGRLALGDGNEEALAQAAEELPSTGNLIELLRGAQRMWAERGDRERAGACGQLAEFYAQREGGREAPAGQGREGERERQRDVDRARDARGNIEDLNHRIEILRLAHGALARKQHKEWAQSMERFIHVAELQRDGADGEALTQAFEGLSMGMTIELLQKASGIYAEWDMADRAAACNRLAEFYAARERGQNEGGERERAQANERERAQANERERRAGAGRERARERGSLENREQRVEILRLAYAAWRESENKRAADLMERVLHLAELQLEGAGDEAIAQASEGLNQGAIIELVAGAQKLYTKWGNQERAGACRRLVAFYKSRAGAQEGEGGEREQAREREQGTASKEAQVHELMQRIERLQLELREIQELLRRLVER